MKQTPTLPNHSKRLADVFQAGTPSSFGSRVPTIGDIAKSAYLSYVNQGSQPGHDVRHWLEAEALLLAQQDQPRAG